METIQRNEITADILREYLDYSTQTGQFTWRKKVARKVVVGRRAGSLVKRSQHRQLKILGTVYPEHRLVWLWVTGEFPKGHIDHINHDELDNRFCNLRDVTQAVNNQNLSLRCDNTLGVTGISIDKRLKTNKYIAELTIAGKRVFRKGFPTLDDAIAARKEQEKLYGFHENHGIQKP